MLKRLFLSEKTVLFAAVFALAACALTFIGGAASGAMDMYGYFELIAKLILAAYLFFGYRKHSILSMQAGCCGLLLGVVFSQGARVFMDLLAGNMQQYLLNGFWGCMLLACELTLFILAVMVTINHYFVYVGNRINLFRVAFNQTLIYIQLLFILFHVGMDAVVFSGAEAVYRIGSVLFLFALFMLISCSELVIALDAGE